MRKHFSLAESFAKGIVRAQHPPERATVCYVVRVFAEINSEELLRLYEVNDRRPLSSRQVTELYHGWVASLDYINQDTGEIVHRAELVRASKVQLHTALWDFECSIRNQRQRRAYRMWLNSYFGMQEVSES
jgi:hypothetical protein